VCQGQTWQTWHRANLAQHVEDCRTAVDEGVRAGMVCRERKEEQARDLLRGGVLSQKGGGHSPSRISISWLMGGGAMGIWGRSITTDY